MINIEDVLRLITPDFEENGTKKIDGGVEPQIKLIHFYDLLFPVYFLWYID